MSHGHLRIILLQIHGLLTRILHKRCLYPNTNRRSLITNTCPTTQTSNFYIPCTIRLLTSISSTSHYQCLFSLPDLRILTTDARSHYHNNYLRILTTNACSPYQTFEFSLPIPDPPPRSTKPHNHYPGTISLPEHTLLITNTTPNSTTLQYTFP